MARLNAKQRAKSAVIKQPGKPASDQKYPIPDKAHAKAALGRINQAKPPLTPAEKAKVRAKAHKVLGDGEVNPATEKRLPKPPPKR